MPSYRIPSVSGWPSSDRRHRRHGRPRRLQGCIPRPENAYGERFATPEVISKSVADGNLGVKSGRGILDLTSADQADLVAYRNNAYVQLNKLREQLGESPAQR